MPAAASPELASSLLNAFTLAGVREHSTAGLDHLLAALFDNASARAALAEFQVDPGQYNRLTAELIGRLVVPPGTTSSLGRLEGSTAFRRVLSRAQARVGRLGRTEVEGHDVILALMAERGARAARMLRDLGVDRRRLTAYIDHGLTNHVPFPAGPIEGDDGEVSDEPPPPALDAAAIEPFLPQQRSAPVRIGARDGRIARVSDRDSTLDAPEADFERWRDAVLEYIGELISAEGAFPRGTNHKQVRTRLETLDRLLRGSVDVVKQSQFRIGQDILRLGGVIESYQSDADDLPDLSAPTLRDLRLLQAQLILGIGKFGNWAEFQRDAAAAPPRGEIIRAAAAETLDVTVATLTETNTSEVVDPELPATFRWIREGLDDPWEATREVVFGAVRSFENLFVFLARTVINTAKGTVTIAAGAISDQVASELLNRLSETARELSAALPDGWTWLQPLLDIIGKLHGWY